MVVIEINAIADVERRRKILAMLPASRDIMQLSELTFARAARLQLLGFRAADAVHVAAAEAQRCDVLLSCDHRLIKAGQRQRSKIRVIINNPVLWMNEDGKRQDK